MLFMVIERFKDRDPAPIYARLREQGRALPEGLRYVDSWVEANFDRCFQLLECDDTVLLHPASRIAELLPDTWKASLSP